MIGHTVRSGERLSAIAARYRVSTDAILAANPAKDRVRMRSGAEVFASLSAGEDIVVPTTPGALGWPWEDCPQGGSANWVSPGCTPTNSIDDYYLLGPAPCEGAVGRHAVVRTVPTALLPFAPPVGAAPLTNVCVCPHACWNGYACDCEATGVCGGDGAPCGALMIPPGGSPDPGATPDPVPTTATTTPEPLQGGAAEAACAAEGGTWDGTSCLEPASITPPATEMSVVATPVRTAVLVGVGLVVLAAAVGGGVYLARRRA